MTTCTLARAIVGFTREASELPMREAPPFERSPCLCEPRCAKPSVRQIVVFLRSYPTYAAVIEQAFPDVEGNEPEPEPEIPRKQMIEAIAPPPRPLHQLFTGHDLRPIVEVMWGGCIDGVPSPELLARAKELRDFWNATHPRT